jgi:hypothetical protein
MEKEKRNKSQEGVWEIQEGGSHYKDFAIQPYEFFFKNKLPHHKAAIIRRIMRYDQKTGHGVEDLRKILHEIRLIADLEGYDLEKTV